MAWKVTTLITSSSINKPAGLVWEKKLIEKKYETICLKLNLFGGKGLVIIASNRGSFLITVIVKAVTKRISCRKWERFLQKSEYLIKAKAWDGLWEVRTSLTIAVEDVNDNPPIFSDSSYEFLVAADSVRFCKTWICYKCQLLLGLSQT